MFPLALLVPMLSSQKHAQSSLPEDMGKTLAGREERESLAVPTEVTRYQPVRLEIVWVNPAGARRIPASLQTQGGN